MSRFLTLHDPAAARAYYAAGLWQDDTFYSLLRHNARISGGDIALISGNQSLTWSALLARVDGLALDLASYDLRPGDRVCGWMSDRAELIIAMLACSRQGLAFNPSLHRNYTTVEVAGLMTQLSARAVIMEEGWGADSSSVRVNAILAEVSSLRVIYTPETFPLPSPNLTAWQTDPDTVVYLAHTSGTTGRPKCVMHTANTLLANARELVRDWRHGRDSVIYSLSPVSHHIAWVGFAQWLLAGCRFVLNAPPPGKTALDWIVETGATYVMGVPTHAVDLLAQEEGSVQGFGRMGTMYLAGAPIPTELCEALMERGITPKNVYGMTENSSHHYTLPQDTAATIIGTCGRGGRAYEIRILDADDPGKRVPCGTVGQIAGRGAALMLGYFDDQSATESSFSPDGWFLSGDLGSIDTEGNLRVVGRLKDTIIRGGHNIYPSRIEAIARQHPGVRHAACVPVPDRRLGERVCLVVAGTATQDEIVAYLGAQGLSRLDMPELFLRMAELPLLPSGKVFKREIAERIHRSQERPTWVVRSAGA